MLLRGGFMKRWRCGWGGGAYGVESETGIGGGFARPWRRGAQMLDWYKMEGLLSVCGTKREMGSG
jgi:hypothetical protein